MLNFRISDFKKGFVERKLPKSPYKLVAYNPFSRVRYGSEKIWRNFGMERWVESVAGFS